MDLKTKCDFFCGFVDIAFISEFDAPAQLTGFLLQLDFLKLCHTHAYFVVAVSMNVREETYQMAAFLFSGLQKKGKTLCLRLM